MRYAYVLLFALAASGCQLFSHSKKGYDYCYANGHGLYVGQYGHDPVHVYVNGTDARLSPDGYSIAYTDVGASDHGRRIGIFDLDAGRVRLLDTSCHNCYGPVWSPDGKYVAYNAFVDGEYSVRCVDKENKHPVEVANRFFSPSWSADSRKMAVQSMFGVNICDLNGKVLQTILFDQFDSTISFTSESNFELNTKEDKLIFWGVGSQ